MMTIGHSTLPIASFLRALAENDCKLLIDVRRYPGSRKYPQYGQDQLFASLNMQGISGVWREELGGRRPALKESINTGWRNESFRGYADYMQTSAFAEQIDWLMGLPDLSVVAIMCAEAAIRNPEVYRTGGNIDRSPRLHNNFTITDCSFLKLETKNCVRTNSDAVLLSTVRENVLPGAS